MSPPRAGARARGAARDARGRFAKGHSGNPRGRPPGIPQPRRRPLDLLLRQAWPGQLAEMFDRKPCLRLPLMHLLLPKARRPDPGESVGVDFSRMRSAAEIAAAMERVVGAMCRGEITPGEAALLARCSRQPLRALRRLMWREMALLKGRLPRYGLGPKPTRRARWQLPPGLVRGEATEPANGAASLRHITPAGGPPLDRAFRRHVSSVFCRARVDGIGRIHISTAHGVTRLRFLDI